MLLRSNGVAFLCLFFSFASLSTIFAEVGADGSWNSNFPIEIPPGRQGVQPNISISYNSNSGNGVLGVGANIQGIQQITRVANLNPAAGNNGGINFNPNDAFLSPSGRLLDLYGNHSRYVPENQTWEIFTPEGICGNGPCSWTVKTRDNWTYVYGESEDSRNYGVFQTTVLSWALTRAIDPNGNFVEYIYLSDQGQIYIKEIRYTRHNSGTLSRFYAVEFEYESRPDIEISYSTNTYVETAWRLKSIRVRGNVYGFMPVDALFAQTVRKYRFSYNLSPTTGRSRLNAIETLGSNESTVFSTQNFSWESSNVGFEVQSGTGNGFFNSVNGASSISRLMDMNGDGRLDMVSWYSNFGNIVRWQLATETGFQPVQYQNVSFSPTNLEMGMGGFVDVNGDGIPDLIHWHQIGEVQWQLGTGSGFSALRTQNGVTGYYSDANNLSRLVDLNGDGTPDLIRWDSSGNVYWSYWSGDGFGQPHSQAGVAAVENSHDVSGILDFNGDGRPDLVHWNNAGTVTVNLATPDGFAATQTFQNLNLAIVSSDQISEIVDINGDGRPDLIRWDSSGNVYWNIGSGNGFGISDNRSQSGVTPGLKGDGQVSLFTDFNGDGKLDLVRWDSTGTVYWNLWLGDGFGPTQTQTNMISGLTSAGYYSGFADMNGDAKLDLVRWTNGGCFDNCANLSWNLGKVGKSDLISGTWNDTGSAVIISYGNAVQQVGAIQPSTINLPKISVAANRTLVTGVLKTANSTVFENMTYQFLNQTYYTGIPQARSDLGFATVIETDHIRSLQKATQYSQDRRFSGIPLSVSVTHPQHGTLSAATYDFPLQFSCNDNGCWQDAAVVLNNPKQLRAGKTTEITYSHGKSISRETENIYDTFGNITETKITTSGNGLTSIKRQINEYVVNIQNPRLIGLPCHKKEYAGVTEDEDSLLSESRLYFGGAESVCQVTAGTALNITKTEKYQGAGIWAAETASYDVFGNVQAFTDSRGIITENTYDATYKTYLTQKTVRSTDSSKSFTTTFTPDTRFGFNSEEIAVNGLRTVKGADIFGRITTIEQYDSENNLRRKTVQLIFRGAGIYDNSVKSCVFFGIGHVVEECTQTYFDALGREIRKIFPVINANLGADSVSHQAVTTWYNASGKILKKSLPFSVNSLTDVGTNGSDFVYYYYNELSELLSVDTPGVGTAYQAVNDGALISGSVTMSSTIDVNGVIKRTYTGIFGKPVRIVDAANTASTISIDYLYNGKGELRQISSPQGITNIDYEPVNGRRKFIADPNAGTTTFEYFNIPGSQQFGNLKKEIRSATGAVSIFEYDDPLGRLSRKLAGFSAAPANESDETIYAYDETGNDFTNTKGKLSTVTYNSKGFIIRDLFRYDTLGEAERTTRRLSHSSETLCADADAMPCLQIFAATKDNVGRKTSIFYPDGKTTNIQYLSNSTAPYVSSVEHDGTTYASYSGYIFDQTPHIGKIQYGNGLVHDYAYNQTTGTLATARIGQANVQPYLDITYSYDSRQNIATVQDAIFPKANIVFGYDTFNRLKSAVHGEQSKAAASRGEYPEEYAYKFDADGQPNSKGNLTQKHNRRLIYSEGKTYPQSDEIRDSEASEWQANQTFGWSAGGNLISKGPFNFTYDDKNMLATALEKESTSSSNIVGETKFFYDQAGQRFLKMHSRAGVTVKTWYIGNLIELREKCVSAAFCAQSTEWQATKFIYGLDGKRMASVTGSVHNAPPTANTDTMFALATGYSSSSITGFARKTYYTFYGIYLHDNFAKYARRSAMVLLLVVLILMALFSNRLHFRFLGNTAEQSDSPCGNSPSQRLVVLLMFLAFVSMHCGTGNQPGSTPTDLGGLGTPGTGSTGGAPSNAAISALYTGLPTGTVYYSHNHLGSGSLVTDTSGNELFRINYKEYGEIDLAKSGKLNPATGEIEHDVSDAELMITAVKFTGQEYDPETGFYYYNARYYDPQLGVFTTADSQFDEGAGVFGFNRHMYVAGNPVMNTDPTGHFLGFIFQAIMMLTLIAIPFLAGTHGDIKGWIEGRVKFDIMAAYTGAIIGFAAAGVGAWAGTAMTAAMGGEAAVMASWGNTLAVGFADGGSGGAFGSAFVTWFNGGSFREGLEAAFTGGTFGALSGAAVAGAVKGIATAWMALSERLPPNPTALKVAGAMADGADMIPDIRTGLNSRTTSPYGYRPEYNEGNHLGVDKSAESWTPIYAADDGIVTASNGSTTVGNSSDVKNHGWGRHTIVDHGVRNGVQLETLSGHLDVSMVSVGDRVRRGDLLGLSGGTGRAWSSKLKRYISPLGDHLHFGIRRNGTFTDPETYNWREWTRRGR